MGDDLAFGMPGSLYGALGDNALFRMAEETEEGSGEFHFPFRKHQDDPESKQEGIIKNITIRALSDNVLQIDVHGEYFFAVIPNPDFNLRFDVSPIIEDGLLTFDVTHDLDVSLFDTLVAGTVLNGLLFGVGYGAMTALLVLGAQELIFEPIAKERTKERADELDLDFLGALPHRLAAERRRWDPLYVTAHQVVTRLDALQITDAGIGFSGRAILDKEPEPVSHIVIRDEGRDPSGVVEELRYRVHDFDEFAADFTRVVLASERLPFERVTDDVETDLVRLTLEQVRERIAVERLRQEIGYLPKRVFIEDNQIRLLLCISATEQTEESDALIEAFRAQSRADILEAQGEELRQQVAEQLEEELGQPPTEEQIQEALDDRLDELVDELQPAFEEDQLPELLDAAIEPLLRFDMDSPEFVDLQREKILAILGFERVEIIREGSVTGYYRDRRDDNREDNLLSLPRYTPANGAARSGMRA